MQNVRFLAAAALLAAIPAACRSYEPRPLALDETQRDFLVRTLDGTPVREFAGRLGAAAADPVSFDPSDGVSLAEAEAIALVFNRDLRERRLAAGVTRASAENAGLWRDPTIGVDLSRIVGGASSGVEAIGSLALTLPLSGRLELERARADAARAVALARIAAEEWTTVSRLRRAWIQRASLAAEAAASNRFLERAAQVLAIVDRMEQAGELARIEARVLRIEELRMRVQLRAIETELARTTHLVESILGLPPRADRPLAGDFGEFAGVGREDPQSLLARVASTAPAVAVARAEYEVAERTLAAEIRAQWPDLEVAPGYGEQDGDTQAVLGLGIVLPVFNGNRRGIAEAEAARELARGKVEHELERVLGDLLAAEERLASAIAQREFVDSTLLPLVETQHREAREVARLGEVNTLILLESLKQELDASRQLIAARRDEALAAVDIEELVGPRDAKNEGVQP